MTRQLKTTTRKETFKTVTETFYEHYSSSCTSSCASLDSFTTSTVTKTESYVREVHFAARSLFPEFFAKNVASKSLLLTEPRATLSCRALNHKRASGPRISELEDRTELEDRIKSWFIREYGLGENRCV